VWIDGISYMRDGRRQRDGREKVGDKRLYRDRPWAKRGQPWPGPPGGRASLRLCAACRELKQFQYADRLTLGGLKEARVFHRAQDTPVPLGPKVFPIDPACASDALSGLGNGGLNRANRALHRYRVGNRVNARLVRAVAGRAGTEATRASAVGSCNHRSPRRRAMPVPRCWARFTVLHPMSDEP
jgi:hypothetical protein